MGRSKTEEAEKLKSSEEWDYERTDRILPRKKARAVVSVAFSREDLELVGEHAERLGQKISAYIRQAAVEKASAHAQVNSVRWFGASMGSFAVGVDLGPTTHVNAPLVEIAGQSESLTNV